MALLKDKDRQKVEEVFRAIVHPVRVIMFTQSVECEYCQMTRELLGELAGLNNRISVEVLDFVEDADRAEAFGVDKIPATIVMGDKDYGIRFYGVPAGYEFMSLIEAIVDVGKRDHALPAAILTQLARVDQPVHMQAMITPTCPYCQRAVRTAHKFAMASDYITGDMVEITEFPQLAVKYGVQGVPNTIINEVESVVGGVSEKDFAKAVLRAIGR
jgi:glutaredoxin-like protein